MHPQHACDLLQAVPGVEQRLCVLHVHLDARPSPATGLQLAPIWAPMLCRCSHPGHLAGSVGHAGCCRG